MGNSASSAGRDDGRLWVIALGLSLLLNVALLGLIGMAAIKTHVFEKPVNAAAAPPPQERVVTIIPEISEAEVAAVQDPGKPKFARTSDDQNAPAPEKKDFIGERDTQATSDRAPDPSAPPLPSQAGIEPRRVDDFETTESDYQDGRLDGGPTAKAAPPAEPSPSLPPTQPSTAEADAGKMISDPGKDEMTSNPPTMEKLLDGPNPVEVAVPKPTKPRDEIKPTPPKREKDGGLAAKPAELPKPPPVAKPVQDPAFAGYQRKAAIVGSISRSGRSALNVAKTPLGRYQALISRAVELEWQRNCVRHRDFITPGYLTVRFFVEPSGKVRTVQFVGKMETGEVQKGFTLNSIRDAEIPAMPAALKKEYAKEPLELIFNFYF